MRWILFPFLLIQCTEVDDFNIKSITKCQCLYHRLTLNQCGSPTGAGRGSENKEVSQMDPLQGISVLPMGTEIQLSSL